MFDRLSLTLGSTALVPILLTGWLVYDTYGGAHNAPPVESKIVASQVPTATPVIAPLTVDGCSKVAAEITTLNKTRLIVRSGDIPEPLMADLDFCLDRKLMGDQARNALTDVGILRNIGRL